MKSTVNKWCKLLFAGAILFFCLQSGCLAFSEKAIDSYNKAIKLTEKEKYEKAIDYFKKSVKIEPSFADAYFNLGILYEFLGEYEKAVETFEKVLQYNPEDYEAMYKLATIHYMLKNYDISEEFVEKIPPENPNFQNVVDFMAHAEERMHNVNRNNDDEKDIKDKINGPRSCKPLGRKYPDINTPAGIVKDNRGNVYIADYNADSIYYINRWGNEELIAHKGIINGPIGLAVDKYDNLYVANYKSDEIVIMPASGKEPHVLPVSVKKPYFLMVDEDGVLYVSEQGDNTISRHKLIWEK